MTDSLTYSRLRALTLGLVLLPAVVVAQQIPITGSALTIYIAFLLIPPWLVGLVIEAVAIRMLFAMKPSHAVAVTIAVNGASLALGVVFYPVVEQLLDSLVIPMATEAFGRNSLRGVVVVGATVVDTAVGLFLLRLFFVKVLDWRRAGGFLVANLLGAVVLLGVLYQEDIEGRLKIRDEVFTQLETQFEPEITLMKEVLKEAPSRVGDPQWEELRSAQLSATRIVGWFITTPERTIWGHGDAFLVPFPVRRQRGNKTIEVGYLLDRPLSATGERPRAYRFSVQMTRDSETYIMRATIVAEHE